MPTGIVNCGVWRKGARHESLREQRRDLEFNLFEVFDLEKALATAAFGDLDGDTVREMLADASKLAVGPVAESFAESDRNPPQRR